MEMVTSSVTDSLTADKATADAQPLRVGVLRQTKKAFSRISTINLMAYMAKNFNIELYLFTPADIDFNNNTVRAILVEGKNRTPKTIPLPKIIDNLLEIFKSKQGKELEAKLNKICHCIRPRQNLSKEKSYDILSTDVRFKKLLIETHELKDFNHFVSLLKQYDNDVIVKSHNGTEGKNVFRVTFDDEKYTICPGNKKAFSLSAEEFGKFYQEKFSQKRYVLQPYIVSRTKYGNPFDIRIHARRGGGGGSISALPLPANRKSRRHSFQYRYGRLQHSDRKFPYE